VFGALPLVWTGPLAFFLLRAGAGLGAAIYDPAARGFLTDATPADRRGEAFGLYGAAQMGGLLLGPTIGALGAERFGGIAFVFVFSAIAAIIAAVAIALRVREHGPAHKAAASPSPDRMTMPPDSPYVEGRAAAALAAEQRVADDTVAPTPATPTRLLNRGLIAAIILNVGGYYGGGTYEVIWSLFLRGLGADLALIGLTFAMFGLPVLVLSPYAGRLVDRRGSYAFIVIGMILPAVTGILYTLMRDPAFAVPLILVEATGFAFLNPALYAVVAANSPPGRSSTAQGLFGAAGTLGFIIASVTTGILAEQSILLPFYSFSIVMIVTLVLATVVGGSRLRGRTTGPAPDRAPQELTAERL
jgi:MFS family permease